jgi:hypothetical protein
MSEIAQRVACRFIEKTSAKVELKVKYPDAKSLLLRGDPHSWTYAYVGSSGLMNSWRDKDRETARVKFIYALKSVIEPRDVERLVKELDVKYDSGHAAA